MFYLDIFTSKEEKKAYLKHLNRELDRVLDCFEKPKILPLRNYADSNITMQDCCVEFIDFIKLMVDKYSPSFPDRRIPSNGQLQQLVKGEILDYKKLKIIVFDLLEELEEIPRISKQATEAIGTIQKHSELLPNKNLVDNEISQENKKAHYKEPMVSKRVFFSNSKEIKTLQPAENKTEPENTKIIWHGSTSSLRKLFFLLAKENLLKDVSADKKLSFIDKFIVNRAGKKFQL